MLKVESHHNVYILGAGFSAPRGLPVISEFMLALRDAHPWLLTSGREREAQAVERVLQYRLESAAAAYRVAIDLENIEELFSLSDTGRDVLAQHIRVAIAATLDFRLFTTAEPTTTFFPESVEILPSAWRASASVGKECRVPMYEFFIQSLLGRWTDAQASSAFVTFNYDCLVDDALRSLSYGVDYGLPGGAVATKVSKSASGSKPTPPIRVLKLHGSVNWTRRKGRDPALQVVSNYRDIADPNDVPELVPPTWRKLFAKEIVPIWKLALGELERATRIVVIGFSMPETDLHFKYLLASGLRKNVALREIVFVDPAFDLIRERARRLFGDIDRRPPVRVIKSTVSGFVGLGTSPDNIHSIGRAVPGAVAHVRHSAY